MRYKVILSVIFSGTFLIAATAQSQTLANATFSSPATITADSSDVTTNPLINHSPFNSIHHNQNCESQDQDDIKTDFQMPIFIPDSSLTESMPIFAPPPVDEKMIIPFNQPSIKQCS